VDENSIQPAIKGELARFKHPKHVYIVNELLCNAMGKAQNSSCVKNTTPRLGDPTLSIK